MKKMLLITRGFPYGTSEQSFIHTEYDTLSEHFDITVFSEGTDDLDVQKGYENVKTIRFEDKTIRKLTGKAILRKDTLNDMADAVREVSANQAIKRLREITGYSARACLIESALRKAIKEVKPNIIYSFWCTPATLAAIRLKKEFPALKVVSRFHGYDLYNERRPSLRQPFMKMFARELDELFFVSELGKNYYYEHWRREGIVNYLGTKRHEKISENTEGIVLVSCSNLIPLKRVELIIMALTKISDDIRLSWHHFGDGEQRMILEQMAEKTLNAKSNINFCFEGFIDNEELIEKYNELKPWLFITTSSTEGLPVSILEALSMGIPCLATKVGGIPEEVITNYNGFLIDTDADPDCIAKVLSDFLKMKKEQRELYRQNAYSTWAEKFNAEDRAKELVEIIERL